MNYHRTRPNQAAPTHRLNVVTISRFREYACSCSCSHFDARRFDCCFSFCRLWAANISWQFVPNSGFTLPARCSGCLEDNSLDVQVEASPLSDGSQPRRDGK
jgi:hypothetical protein